MLAKPSAAFSLPSLHDDLELKCRLYFPPLQSTERPAYFSGFVLFAHPYAPLGGCFDDPVVHTVGSVLVKQGFLLGTFNFRGAEGSLGKTSWSGKGELGDYVSLYTFILAFMNEEGVSHYFGHDPLLILGGYSYGSMIASHLPNIDTIWGILQNASDGSSEREIERRSVELAQAFLGYCETQGHRGGSSLQSLSTSTPNEVVLGGYESSSAARRISDQSLKGRVDAERVRHSVDRVRRKFRNRTQASKELERHSRQSSQETRQPLITPRLAFLLISPLLGTVSSFATMFSKLKFDRIRKASQTLSIPSNENPGEIFAKYPTLIVFGSDDHFTSSRKVRDWCTSIAAMPRSQLDFQEIEGVGHFWQSASNEAKLESIVSTWLKSFRPVSD